MRRERRRKRVAVPFPDEHLSRDVDEHADRFADELADSCSERFADRDAE
jgi:hypothetical protein